MSFCNSCGCNNCSGCQSSILNNQSSIIPNPICSSSCGNIQGCIDIVYSNCVIYTGPNLTCSGIFNGYNLNAALAAINSQLCISSGVSGICTVKVDNNDTCCGFLRSKILSNSLSITVNNPEGCESLQIEQKPWVWNNLNLFNGWSQAIPFGASTNTASASYGVRCFAGNCNYDDIRFRGYVKGPTNQSSGYTVTLCQIPLIAAPSEFKTFSYSYFYGTIVVVVTVTITTSGNIVLIFNSLSTSSGTSTFSTFFSLDILNYV